MSQITTRNGMGTTTVRTSRIPRDMASDVMALELIMASRGLCAPVMVR